MDEEYDVILEDVETGIRPRSTKPVQKKEKSVNWQFAGIAGQIGFDIALPMVLGLIIGTKLDAKWGTSPKYTLGLFAAGLLLSCTSLIHIVKDSTNRR